MSEQLNKFFNKLQETPVLFGNQFKVTLSNTGVPSIEQDIEFFAKGVDLPGKTIEEAEIQYQGMRFRLPGGMTYSGTITLDCFTDNNMNFYEDCKAWQNHYGNMSMGGGGDKRIPEAKVILDLYDPSLTEIVRTYELQGCFPSEIGEIALTHESVDVATFPLSIMYQYHNELGDDPLAKASGGILGLAKNIIGTASSVLNSF